MIGFVIVFACVLLQGSSYRIGKGIHASHSSSRSGDANTCKSDGSAPGSPLLLTPLIEKGQVKFAYAINHSTFKHIPNIHNRCRRLELLRRVFLRDNHWGILGSLVSLPPLDKTRITSFSGTNRARNVIALLRSSFFGCKEAPELR